jgi:hypothetical protein
MKVEEMAMEQNNPKAQQASILLPHFDYEVPVVYVEDGTAYIPVIALCKMLGLHADTHIPRWRRLILWCNARKLLCCMSDGRRRNVWCLHMGALLFWFSCFDWSLVLPERRAQLQQATDEWMSLLDQAHSEMFARYKVTQRILYKFLTENSDVEAALDQFSPALHIYLDDFDVSVQWEDIVCQGKALINQAAAHARNMLHERVSNPIVDGVGLHADGEVSDEFAIPLFPIVKEEDFACFLHDLKRLSQWHQQVMDFLSVHGIFWNRERKRWYLA